MGRARKRASAEPYWLIDHDTLLGRIQQRAVGALTREAAVQKKPRSAKAWLELQASVRESWKGAQVSQERTVAGKVVPGLRAPQVGAYHAVLAHWSVSEEPATITMPTGTGKTETMLALLVDQRPERLLIVVPTDALRRQIAGKVQSLGILRAVRIIDDKAVMPIVGILTSKPRSAADAADFFSKCNVVVTTMAIAGQVSAAVLRTMADHFTHLFIDEAHHVAAATWASLREQFSERRVLQFTATPFREDGKHIEGRAIYTYPLRLAQEHGYFSKIHFKPVEEYDETIEDEAVAKQAVGQLKADMKKGLNHFLMARTDSIERAKTVHKVYTSLVPELKPMLVHSKLGEKPNAAAVRALKEGKSRVIVCVNMLGEGFDMPQLKIAALHETHRSLTITLQFIGRFTRGASGLGDATIVANLARQGAVHALRELYAQDSDWNVVLRYLAGNATGKYAARAALAEGFDGKGKVSIQNVEVPLNAFAYRFPGDACQPTAILDLIPEARLLDKPDVNLQARLAIFVERVDKPVEFGQFRDLKNVLWELTALHWDHKQHLLYINTPDERHADRVARVVGGKGTKRITGMETFRVLHGINRMVLMNLGLKNMIGRSVSFSMYVGPDVEGGLANSQLQNRIKTNLFARGYENGDTASIGVSQKGKIWSQKTSVADLSEWAAWCRALGSKLNDTHIKVDKLIRNKIRVTEVDAAPQLVALAMDWPERLLDASLGATEVQVGSTRAPLYEASLEIISRTRGELRFAVAVGSRKATYSTMFSKKGIRFIADGPEASLVARKATTPVSEALQEEPPVVFFEGNAVLYGNRLFQPSEHPNTLFDLSKIAKWDWKKIDLRKESQGKKKDPRSIQAFVIRHAKHRGSGTFYDFIIDDDGSQEAADVVAIRSTSDRIVVHFYHCKYSHGDAPGARVEDLYEVMGQSQKSVRWRSSPARLVEHLLRRANRRLKKGYSGLERGDLNALGTLKRRADELIPEFKIFAVQPGIARSRITDEMRRLLGATELYLRETFDVAFEVITSP